MAKVLAAAVVVDSKLFGGGVKPLLACDHDLPTLVEQNLNHDGTVQWKTTPSTQKANHERGSTEKKHQPEYVSVRVRREQRLIGPLTLITLTFAVDWVYTYIEMEVYRKDGGTDRIRNSNLSTLFHMIFQIKNIPTKRKGVWRSTSTRVGRYIVVMR